MQVVLLGGAPGVGKSSAARELLRLAETSNGLTQWIDVDNLWLHQPWRVDDAMTSMLRENLRAVLANSAAAGVDVAVVTWVFQDSEMHSLVGSLAPDGTSLTTIQLLASAATWRQRFERDPARPDLNEFFERRYGQAQATPVDHTIQTDDIEPIDVATLVAALVTG